MILKALTFALAPQLNGFRIVGRLTAARGTTILRDPLKAQSLDQSQLFDQPRKSSTPLVVSI